MNIYPLCAGAINGSVTIQSSIFCTNQPSNDRLSVFEEEVIKIADDMNHDFRTVIKNGREKRVADPDMVARARLRIEVRFKHLKAGRPAKWGDVSTLNVKSQDEFDTSNLS